MSWNVLTNQIWLVSVPSSIRWYVAAGVVHAVLGDTTAVLT
jgi:hypothetical protein